MKYLSKRSHLPLLVLGAGLVGAFARWALYVFGTDESGLLIRGHFLHLLCWGLTVAVFLCITAISKKAEDSENFSLIFPENKYAILPALLTGAGILATVLQHYAPIMDKLTIAWTILGLLSVPALVIIGWLRYRGRRPGFYLHGIVCLFYAMHLVCRYREWSGNPQIPDYSFQLLACVALMLASYQRMAFCAGLGRSRLYLMYSLMAAYLCILSSVGSDYALLYITSGCACLFDLSAAISHHDKHRQGPREVE